jgi:23S rRNA (cytosine1962-C5)-methyltransferase
VVSELKLTDRGDSRRRSGHLRLGPRDLAPESSTGRNGDVVDLLTEDGDFRGRGFFSREQPSVRVISESKVDVDLDYYRDRIGSALERRRRILDGVLSYRLVHSDADFLPGLVVDRYGDYLVVQERHPTVEDHRDKILKVLEELLSPRSIYARNDLAVRSQHGLDRHRGLLRGEPIPDRVRVRREPFEVLADLKNGQKTGYFLDQRENRQAFERYVRGERLDCFSYTGGWGLHALQGGADRVTFVDQSEDALSLLRENLRRNGWMDRAEIIEDDGFDVLNRMARDNRSYDFIALDPPSFARSSSQLDEARRGYKEVNLRSMRMVKDEGILATSSCSAPVSRETFVEIVRESASDAHTACRVLEERGQPPDHPWLTDVSATRYLKCLICEISLR